MDVCGNRPFRAAVAAACVVAWLAPGPAPCGEAGPAAVPPVTAELLVNVKALCPGKPFLAGVLLKMRPGWHVYWKNPGDAGLATAVTFRLPKGFSAAPLRWPVPATFRQPGDIVGYGYGTSVLLSAEITSPKDLPVTAPVEIAADVSYLACKAQCIPGKAVVRRTVAVARRVLPVRARLFEQWAARLPVPVGRAGQIADASLSRHSSAGAAGRFTLTVTWKSPPKDVQWYPAAGAATAVDDILVKTDGTRTRITFRATALAGAKPAARALETVVAYHDARGVRRGAVVAVPLRAPGGVPAAGSGK